jgi:guanylate kinase
MPPSLEELRSRLISRNTDSNEVIDYRMQQAEDEVSHLNEYEENIINDDFEIALQELSNYFERNINN